ncbi:MAG: hypothetical protein ACTIJJ_14475 [Galactobacter sp.]
MTVTTIKVPSEIRDVLKRQAAQEHRTLAEHLEHLAAAEEDKRVRFQRSRTAMTATPPDEEYLREAHAWQSDAGN